MRSRLMLVAAAAAALFVVGTTPTASGDKPSADKQLFITLRVCEGDPLGGQDEGALKVLAEPCLVTQENKPFSFLSGGEFPVPDGPEGHQFVPFGRAIEGRSSVGEDGAIRLDITLADTTIGERTEAGLQLHTQSTRTITTVKLGEVVKLRWPSRAADAQAWAELKVEQFR